MTYFFTLNYILQLYRALVQSRSINVKQTLACSLHEVAKILSSNEEISIGESNSSGSGSNSRSGSNSNSGSGVGSGSGNVSGSSGGGGVSGGSGSGNNSNSNSGNNSSSVSIFTGGVSLVEGELIPIFESMLQVSRNQIMKNKN